jgi:hypothetical protein
MIFWQRLKPMLTFILSTVGIAAVVYYAALILGFHQNPGQLFTWMIPICIGGGLLISVFFGRRRT